ncbi:uncharacterized protein [Fopius arisanus]|uniref:Uncharacterized protein n=2 Tax=Fopius arisanus TaxID=64838 RepID=A0A9R1TB93_9HYME|nr:PREDICTED: uncharacterized protein LOC105268268 [Fopius arisanus]
MAADPLEEKINKIRQQNEEIKRRYEEVEADKKNAAKSNALVQMVPSTDWPERKEPPEFSSPPVPSKNHPKLRNSPRDHNGSIQYRAGGEGKKTHTFPQNEGPPPDPKYNFLADSEREEHHENSKDPDKIKGRGKSSRGHFKKQKAGREWQSREYRGKSGGSGQDSLPDYEAWRAERNKIDEARISRQRTAEGNWKREWDNDKMHLADDVTRKDSHTLGDWGYTRNFYSHGRESDQERKIINSIDKNVQVTVNHGSNSCKNPLMSVKVSSPNIVGTGRVGPRQRTRVMYSQSDKEFMNFEVGNFSLQKFPEDKSKPKGSNKKSPRALRREHERSDKFHKREGDGKTHSFNNKDFKNFQKSLHAQRQSASTNYQSKSPRNTGKFGKDLGQSPKVDGKNSSNEDVPINEGVETALVDTSHSAHLVDYSPESIEFYKLLEGLKIKIDSQEEKEENKGEESVPRGDDSSEATQEIPAPEVEENDKNDSKK